MRKQHVRLAVTAVFIGMTAASYSEKTEAAGTELSVATCANTAPYEYCEEQEIIGIDMEIAGLIADELGLELEICNMSFEDKKDSVLSGTTDIAIGQIVEPEEASDDLVYSDGYLDISYAVVVPEKDDIEDTDELTGRTIGAAGFLREKELAEQFSEKKAYVYENPQDAVEELEKGNLEALILEERTAMYLCLYHEGIRIADTISEDEQYVIAVKNHPEEFLTEINDALQTMKETGELDRIVEKYLGEENEDLF